MYRKIFTVALASLSLGAFAQEEATEVVSTPDTATAKEKGICHWSVGVKGGINYMKNAPVADADRKLGGNFNGQFGVFTEATFNPRWGLGLDYTFAVNNQGGEPGFASWDGKKHNITLFSSFNVSNVVSPYRRAGLQKLNVYLNPGVLVAAGKWENAENIRGFEAEDTYATWGLSARGAIEYNVSNYIAVGLDGGLAWHARTFSPLAVRQHYIGDINLAVRFKFGGERNIRNVAWVDYAPKCDVPDLTPVLEEQKRQCEELTSKLEEQIVNQNVAINKLQQQIKFTQDSLDRHIKATREAVKYVPTKEEDEIIKTAFAQLEFESSKAIIKQSSYSSLDGLAMLLKSHPEWSVILKGYTDNSGNAAKNLQLSKDRAASVKNYLINKGVSAANIQSQGYGSANPIASNSTLDGRAKNRRVEIELFSK